MKKKLAGLMLAFALFVPGVLMTACTPAKVVSFEVELANQEYEFVQNQVVVEWGNKVDIGAEDFVVTATLDNDTTKVLSEKSAIKDGYTFSSNIPDDTITPLGEYKLTFTYGDLDPYEIGLVVEKANVDMSGVTWNYTEPFGYDGTAKTVEVTNLPSGVSVTYQDNSKTNIGDYNAVAIFDVADTTHYNPIPNMTLAWKIEKGTIDVSGMTWNYTEPFVYDGQPKSVIMSGLPAGCGIAYTGTTSATAVGNYTATAIITPPTADLYNEIDEITLNWKIVKADLAPVASVGEISKVYAGEDITITKDMITGLPANYAVKAITGDVTARNVGTYNITISFEYTGEGAENYNDIPDLNWTWAITPAPLALTPFAQATYGQEATNNGFSGNFVGSDDKTVLKGEAQYDHDYKVGNNAGEYTITLSGLTADNYTISFEEGTLVVEKAPLMLTPYADNVLYGDGAKYSSYGYTIEGFLFNDTKNVITGSVTYESFYSKGDAPGEYKFFISKDYSSLTAQNYELIFVDGTITCLKRPLTITANDVEVVIGNEAVNAGVNFEGFAGTETESVLSGTLAYDFGGYNPQTAQVGDTFAITPSGLTSANYEITYTPGTLTVVIPEGLQEEIDGIALSVNEFDYVQDTQPTLEVDATTIPEQVEIGTITVKEGEAILPGTYTAVIELNYTGSETYILKPIERTFTINKVEIDPSDINTLNSLTLTQSTFVYDGTEKTVTLSNLPTWAKVSESTNTSGTVVGSWGARFEITVSDESFYVAFEPVSITLTWNISPAELTITVNDNTITYGEDPANAGFTATGLVGNDTEDVITGFVYTYGGYEAGNNVGEYEMTIENANAENYNITIVAGTLIVEPAEINLSNATWGTQTEFVFSGEPIMPELKNLPEGVEVNYQYFETDNLLIGATTPINVGSYTVRAVLVNQDNENIEYLNIPTDFVYEITQLTIDLSNAEWTIANNAEIDYTGELIQPTIVGYPAGSTHPISIEYYCTAFDGVDQIDAIAPGKYIAYAEIQQSAAGLVPNVIVTGVENNKLFIEFEIIANEVKDFAWNVTDTVSENEGELNFEISITTAQINAGYEVYLTGSDLDYVDIAYTLNGNEVTEGNPTIVSTDSKQTVEATLTLKEEYQGSSYVLEITKVILNITVSEEVFASLTLNGEDFAEENLEDGISFEYGSVLAFTPVEGYVITDDEGNEISSITFNDDNNINQIRVYAGSVEGTLVQTYYFNSPYYLTEFYINGTKYTHETGNTVEIELAKDQTTIEISFDESYLNKYDFMVGIRYIGDDYISSENHIDLDTATYTVQNATNIESFILFAGEKGGTGKSGISHVYVREYSPFAQQNFVLEDFNGTESTYDLKGQNLDLTNQVIKSINFVGEGENPTTYTDVRAYSDFACTKAVNLLDIDSYNTKATYFAVYDAEQELVAVVLKKISYQFTTVDGIIINPILDTQTVNTNGSSVAKVVFADTSDNLSVSATLNSQAELALSQDITQDVAMRLEITVGTGETAKTYFTTSTWTVLRHYDANQRIVAFGTVENTNPECEEGYQIAGNNLNLANSEKYDVLNIKDFEDELMFLEFETLEGYTISSRALTQIGNDFYVELSFVDAQSADAGKCLIKLYFYGLYNNDTTVLAFAKGLTDGSEQELEVTNDTITVTDLSTQLLVVVTGNTYAYAIVTDSQGNKIADNAEYGFVMAQFKTAGTYSLIVYATDGTTKTYAVIAQGEYLPALSITVGEDSYVLEVSVEEGMVGDYYSDSDENLVAYIGEDKLALVEDGNLAITSLKSSLLAGAVVADQDGTVLTATQLANGFNLKVLYTEDDNEYPYVKLNVTNTVEGEEVSSAIILYLTEVQDVTVLKIVVQNQTLKANMSLDGETFSGDFDVVDTPIYTTFTAYLGKDTQNSIDTETNTFTITSIEFLYDAYYVDAMTSKPLEQIQNFALTVGSEDGIPFVRLGIIFSIENQEYVMLLTLFLDEPLFQIKYQAENLVEFMSIGSMGPTFAGNFEVSQNQGVITFVGYLGSYKGEGDLPQTITIDEALCTQGETFKDGFANPNTVLTEPFKNVALTVGTYQETPAVCILVDEDIVIYLLLADSYPATFTFGTETFNVKAEYMNMDFGDMQIGDQGPELVIAEEVESFTVTFNKTFDDLSYSVITDAEAVYALMQGTTTLADLIAEGKVYYLENGATSYTAPITFTEGVARILVLAEGCTGQETTDELETVIMPVTIYVQTAE